MFVETFYHCNEMNIFQKYNDFNIILFLIHLSGATTTTTLFTLALLLVLIVVVAEMLGWMDCQWFGLTHNYHGRK